MIKMATTVLGMIVCSTGIAGFFAPTMFNMVLNPFHNIFLISMGTVGICAGILAKEKVASLACLGMGSLFAILGLGTLMAGPGTTSIPGIEVASQHLWKLLPGKLEYSTADGLRDFGAGLAGVVAALMLGKGSQRPSNQS